MNESEMTEMDQFLLSNEDGDVQISKETKVPV